MGAAFIPLGGLVVLNAVGAGRSAWHGWDGGHAASTREGQAAFAARRDLILNLRERGLLTDENQLTELARDALQLLEAGLA